MKTHRITGTQHHITSHPRGPAPSSATSFVLTAISHPEPEMAGRAGEPERARLQSHGCVVGKRPKAKVKAKAMRSPRPARRQDIQHIQMSVRWCATPSITCTYGTHAHQSFPAVLSASAASPAPLTPAICTSLIALSPDAAARPISVPVPVPVAVPRCCNRGQRAARSSRPTCQITPRACPHLVRSSGPRRKDQSMQRPHPGQTHVMFGFPSWCLVLCLFHHHHRFFLAAPPRPSCPIPNFPNPLTPQFVFRAGPGCSRRAKLVPSLVHTMTRSSGCLTERSSFTRLFANPMTGILGNPLPFTLLSCCSPIAPSSCPETHTSTAREADLTSDQLGHLTEATNLLVEQASSLDRGGSRTYQPRTVPIAMSGGTDLAPIPIPRQRPQWAGMPVRRPRYAMQIHVLDSFNLKRDALVSHGRDRDHRRWEHSTDRLLRERVLQVHGDVEEGEHSVFITSPPPAPSPPSPTADF